eukprot:708330-Amphidinium_carterae.1
MTICAHRMRNQVLCCKVQKVSLQTLGCTLALYLPVPRVVPRDVYINKLSSSRDMYAIVMARIGKNFKVAIPDLVHQTSTGMRTDFS